MTPKRTRTGSPHLHRKPSRSLLDVRASAKLQKIMPPKLHVLLVEATAVAVVDVVGGLQTATKVRHPAMVTVSNAGNPHLTSKTKSNASKQLSEIATLDQ